MSNRVTIEPTKFENVRTGEITYGIRMYDDEDLTYDNTWECVSDDDLDVLNNALKCPDRIANDMFDYVWKYKTGIRIGDKWYEWNEIKPIFDKYYKPNQQEEL